MTIKEVSEKYGISQDTLRYYERIGLIPPVPRTPGGIRDYQEKDLGWVEQAVCMRSAGVQIEALIEYVRLYQMGDSTIEARRDLLQDATMERLKYKISRYQKAVETGVLSWEKEEEN